MVNSARFASRSQAEPLRPTNLLRSRGEQIEYTAAEGQLSNWSGLQLSNWSGLEHLAKRLNRRLWIPMTARIRFNTFTGIMETSHEWESLIPTICASVFSGRPFRRQFNLADYVEVAGASFENGLLQIELMRKLPEAMKPRRIAVNAGDGNDHQQIEHSQAA
jgi:hypothetical protein